MSHYPYLGPTYTRMTTTSIFYFLKNIGSAQSTSDIIRYNFQSSAQYQNELRGLEPCLLMYSIDIFPLFC